MQSILLRIYSSTPLKKQRALADFLGIDTSAISSWKKHGSVPKQHVDLVCAEFGLDKAFVLGEELEPAAGAREWMGAGTARETGGGFAYTRGADPIVHVPGDEQVMLRTSYLDGLGDPSRMEWLRWPASSNHAQPGDRLLVDRSRTKPLAGPVYVIQIGEAVLLSRLDLDDAGRARPRGAVLPESATLRILGRVVLLVREMGES